MINAALDRPCLACLFPFTKSTMARMTPSPDRITVSEQMNAQMDSLEAFFRTGAGFVGEAS